MAAVLVRSHGLDANHSRAQGRAFYVHQDGRITLSASGVVVDVARGLVVTCASLVTPFVKALASDHRRDDGASDEAVQLAQGTLFDVLLPAARTDVDAVVWHKARLVAIRDAPRLRQAIGALACEPRNWTIGWALGEKGALPMAELEGIASAPFSLSNVNVAGFALLQVDPQALATSKPSPAAAAAAAAANAATGRPIVLVGDDLVIHGSPYGLLSPGVFFNSTSVGIVSNIVSDNQHKGSLYITDARTLPGLEGGAVFHALSGQLAGLVITPIRHYSHPVDFSLVVPIDVVMEALNLPLRTTASISAHKTSSLVNKYALGPVVGRSVVLIRIGQSWASGIIVSQHGHILTNAHVVRPFARKVGSDGREIIETDLPVQVRLHYPRCEWVDDVKVLWFSGNYWDVAVLQMHPSRPIDYCSIDLAASASLPIPKEGSDVVVVGHGVFPPSACLGPSCTRGVLSKIARHRDRAILLESTALVHQGNSGGLLADATTGAMIGLITSNVRHSNGDIIPHLNFAIPLNDILVPIANYVRTEAASSIQSLAPLFESNKAIADMVDLQAVGPLPGSVSQRVKEILNKRVLDSKL